MKKRLHEGKGKMEGFYVPKKEVTVYERQIRARSWEKWLSTGS
ncbi:MULTISPECIES: hypothetical protein [Bacillaceae]